MPAVLHAIRCNRAPRRVAFRRFRNAGKRHMRIQKFARRGCDPSKRMRVPAATGGFSVQKADGATLSNGKPSHLSR
jgi:hypothetical protein